MPGAFEMARHIYTSNKKPFTSKRKKEMKGWLNTSIKNAGKKDELSTTCNP